MTHEALRDRARLYYDARVAQHGPTPAGVDWNSLASQEVRFQQLARLWERQPETTLLDYGCGYGALAGYVRRLGHRGAYTGFDVSDRMITEARRHLAQEPDCQVTSCRADLDPADYAVASGIFNVKQDASEEEWTSYVRDTLGDLAALGRRGFAFNALTHLNDPERRRPDLFYVDAAEYFAYCQRTFSRFVALLHDYPLYEFTIIVRT